MTHPHPGNECIISPQSDLRITRCLAQMLDSAHELETGPRVAARSDIRRHASGDLSGPIALLSLLDSADPVAHCYFVVSVVTREIVPNRLCERNYLVRGILLLDLPRDAFLWRAVSSSCV